MIVALLVVLLLIILLLLLVAVAVIFGGPKTPPPMTVVNEQFKSIDFSDLPPLRHFESGDGEQLAYRVYTPRKTRAAGSVVLVHGSAGSSDSMHILARGLADVGYTAYALDIRGHGASGHKGTIAYVGQLEDDLDAFVRAVAPPPPLTLLGFSAGGGFVIRFAGSERQGMFHSYLLLSPFLSQDAPTLRPDGGGWVNVGMSRMLALSVLNMLGIRWLNDLPVIRFALNEEAQSFLTPAYSFTLAANFRPLDDYEQNIRKMRRPCAIVAGIEDDVFYTDRFEPTLRTLGKSWPVKLLPGIGHAALTLDPRGVYAAICAVKGLQERG